MGRLRREFQRLGLNLRSRDGEPSGRRGRYCLSFISRVGLPYVQLGNILEKLFTPDLGGSATTTEFGKAVIEEMR